MGVGAKVFILGQRFFNFLLLFKNREATLFHVPFTPSGCVMGLFRAHHLDFSPPIHLFSVTLFKTVFQSEQNLSRFHNENTTIIMEWNHPAINTAIALTLYSGTPLNGHPSIMDTSRTILARSLRGDRETTYLNPSITDIDTVSPSKF